MHQSYPIAVITQGVGGGGGVGLNFATNPIQSSTLTGWTKGSPGSYTSTPAWSATQNLYGGGAMLVTFSAGTKTANDYFEGDLNPIQPDQLGQAWQVKFAMWIDSGATFVANDLEIGFWDVTNSNFISMGYIPVARLNGLVNVSFQGFPSLSTSYKLRIRSLAGSTTCVGNFRMGDVSISPWNGIMAPAVEGWIDYIPTFSVGFGTVSAIAGKYRRIGDSIDIVGSFVTTTPVASAGTISLPLIGITAKETRLIGTWRRNNASAATSKRGSFVVTAGNNYVSVTNDADGPGQSPATIGSVNTLIASGESVYFEIYGLPIAQWSSTVQLSSESVEYLFNTSTATAANDYTSFGYGIQGAQIQNLTATIERRVRSQHPIGPTDEIAIEWSFDRIRWSNKRLTNGSATIMPGAYQNPNYFGIGAYVAYVIGTNDIDILFGAYADANNTTFGGTGTPWSAGAGAAYWRVVIYRGGRNAEVPPKVLAIYDNMVAAAGGTGAMRFATKRTDTHGAYDSVSTGKFRCPVAQNYRISWAYPPATNDNWSVFINDVQYMGHSLGAAMVASGRAGMSITIPLQKDDLVHINCGANVAADANSWIQFESVGR